MTQVNELKKWSKERIKAELRDKGVSLAALSREHGKSRNYFTMVLNSPLRHGEKIIADILGVHPSIIWPDRYDENGFPYQGRFFPKNDGRAKEAARQAQKDAS